MLCMFAVVSRKERVWQKMEIFRKMPSRDIREHIKNYERYCRLGELTDEDLENLEAARLVLRERSLK